MNRLRTAAALVVLASIALGAAAQPASAPRAGPGPARWGPGVTPGWALMTEAERRDHQERMRSMTSHEGCMAMMRQHHEQMKARARERGTEMPHGPRREACAGLGP